jgi:hypothetical protein
MSFILQMIPLNRPSLTSGKRISLFLTVFANYVNLLGVSNITGESLQLFRSGCTTNKYIHPIKRLGHGVEFKFFDKNE